MTILTDCESSTAPPAAASARLQVGISSFGAYMLGVGTLVGSMAWLIHGSMIARAGALPSLVSWGVGALIMLPLALVLAELAGMFPTAGGPYLYKLIALRRLLPSGGGDFLGFLTGWLYWIAMMTGLSCMAIGFGDLVSGGFGLTAHADWVVPASILALVTSATAINLLRVRSTSLVINLFTLLKLGLAVLFLVLIFCSGSASTAHLLDNTRASSAGDFLNCVKNVLLLAVVAYSGLEVTGCASSETENAQSSVPKAILTSLCTVALMYTGLSFGVGCAAQYSGVLGAGTSTDTTSALTAAAATCPTLARTLSGTGWGLVMSLGVVLSIFSCGVGALLANARISYSMSLSGLFPPAFARLNERTCIPEFSLWFQFWFISCLALGAHFSTRTGLVDDAYTFLGEVYGFLYSALAILYGVSLIILRLKAPELHRPFRVGTTGNGAALACAAAVIITFIYLAIFCANWMHQLTGLVLLAIGVPIYFASKSSPSSKKADDSSEVLS